MQGVLVIAHGSRAKETEATLEAVLELVKTELPNTLIEHAFMEFSDRTIAKSLAALAAQGVSELKIVPYFLFMGIHLQQDIPEMLAETMQAYPQINYTITNSLGADARLAAILVDRISN